MAVVRDVLMKTPGEPNGRYQRQQCEIIRLDENLAGCAGFDRIVHSTHILMIERVRNLEIQQ